MEHSAITSGQSNIAAMLLETAQSVLHSSVPEGFEWVQEYGMYYSPSTRYFYDMNTGLFYHSDTQTYYYFDESTGSYCVYANMQKKKWGRSRYQKRAETLLGETELQRYGQDEVDICELLFTVVDKVVDIEWEKECERKYGRRHRERERDRRERHDRREKKESRKRKRYEREKEERKRRDKSKRAYYDGEEVYVSSEEDKTTKGKKHENDETRPSSSDDHSSEENVEVNGDDERIQMMQEEGLSEAPLLRIIDQHGQLHIVTIEGAWIGSHAEATIRSDSLSEQHAEIFYDPGDKDRPHGFRMRVLVNDSSTSLDGHPLEENDEISLEHGSWFTAGDMILIIHVHYGYNSCPKCDPGQMKPIEKKIEKLAKPATNGQSKLRGNAARLKALNAMKQHYGIAEYEPSETRYIDRASMRRQEVGSDYSVRGVVMIRRGAADPNDIYSNCVARPVPGAVIAKPKTMDTPIEAENKGFKLLKAMGWQEGKGLGKEQGGRAEPVAVVQKSDRAGLGTQSKEAPKSHKQMMIDVMRKRFDEITDREK